MKTDEYFRFPVNISLEGYKCKTDAVACLSRAGANAIGMHKMAFKENRVTPAEFLGYATGGHTFCNLFEFKENEYWVTTDSGSYKASPFYKRGANKGAMKVNFKADKFFKGSYTVFVDIDNTAYTDIGRYIDAIELKPTMVYASYSDGKDKHGVISRRFRMVYVFSSMIAPENFDMVSRAVHEHVSLCTSEPIEDFCGVRPSQYMNGVYGNNETYCTSIIYSESDFQYTVTPPAPQPVAIQNMPDAETISFDEGMLKDMTNMEYKDFMHLYSLQYRYLYRTERDDGWICSEKIGARYQLTDEDYLQLWIYNEPVADGNHRRRKLFKNACLRRLMFPEMSASEMLFNLYIDTHRFFDNSDGVITVDVLKRKVVNAFKMSDDELKDYCLSEMRYWKAERPAFIVKHESGVDMKKAVNIIGAEIRYNEIDLMYDPSISLAENIANGIGVPQSTLYRYCLDRGIDTSPRDALSRKEARANKREEKSERIEKFKALYDPHLSVRELKKKMDDFGLKISVGTITRWTEKYMHSPKMEGKVSFQAFQFKDKYNMLDNTFVPEPQEKDDFIQPSWSGINVPVPSFLNLFGQS